MVATPAIAWLALVPLRAGGREGERYDDRDPDPDQPEPGHRDDRVRSDDDQYAAGRGDHPTPPNRPYGAEPVDHRVTGEPRDRHRQREPGRRTRPRRPAELSRMSRR